MLDERSLTKGEDNKKEKYIKGMKKSFSDFKGRYGDDAKSVMYATATKMAKEDVVDESIGLDLARVIDKTKPPLGRDSKRRKISLALKMREVSKTAAKNKKREMAKEENIEEIAPVVAGAAAVGKMAVKAVAKKGLQKVGKAVTADAAKAMVGGKVKKGPVAAGSKVVGKSAKPQSSSVVKSAGMQSKQAPSVPKKSQTPTEPKAPTNTSEPSKPQEPTKPKEPGKQKEKKKGGVEDGVKKGYQSVKSKVTGFTAMFDPKESYVQDSELLTFSDFREIVSICVSDAEELEEFNIVQNAMDVVDTINRKNTEKTKRINNTLGRDATSMPNHGYFTPKKEEITNEGAAWTKKSGKNSEGGLNEKGRKSYEKANPGSDLKAPSKKVGNPRRASFCARMSGMKKKLTSKKTANDPDSRINKSLRKWNC
jgi:hypothetical protein